MAGGFGLDSRADQIEQCRLGLATAAAFPWSCVAQAASHGDGPRHLLHASA